MFLLITFLISRMSFIHIKMNRCFVHISRDLAFVAPKERENPIKL